MDFEDRKSSNDIINNATMSDDEVVASYGPPRSLFLKNKHHNVVEHVPNFGHTDEQNFLIKMRVRI